MMKVKLSFEKGHEEDITEMAGMMGDRSSHFKMGEVEKDSDGDLTMIVEVDKGFDMEIVEEGSQFVGGFSGAGMVRK